MRLRRWLFLGGPFLFLALLSMLAGCHLPTTPDVLTVFCAASLSSTLEQTAEAEGLRVRTNSAGSNALVHQVVSGAPADLLLLADDRLARQKLVPLGYRLRELATNELVLISPRTSASSVASQVGAQELIEQAGQLAVADPQSAPLGQYTREALQGWSPPRKLVPLADSNAVVSAVALGHAPYGIVYRSDALAEPRTQVLATIDRARHSPVRYVAALKPDAPAEAEQLVESLRSGLGREQLKRAGFLPLESP